MIQTTRVFISGNSQAVRLPKEFQFAEQEVKIQRVGNAIILFPVRDRWETLRNSLEQFTEDFMVDGRKQPIQSERDLKNVFD